MRLREFLRPDFVVLSLASTDVEGVVGEVAAQAEAAGVGPAALVGEKLLEREMRHPTVMGSGLAIPHATVPGLAGPVVGVALARRAVSFGDGDLGPVQAFFILLSPPGHEREHVKLLARICRLVRHEGFLDQLRAADSHEEVISIIESVDGQHV